MPCWNTLLNTSNKRFVAIIMVATFFLFFPHEGHSDSGCEFEFSCNNVESMTISYGPSPLNADAEGKWLDSYRCAVALKNKEEKAFENFIRGCPYSHYSVTANGIAIAREATSSVPIGEWFIFYDESLKGILSKASAICADKVVVEPSANEAER